jgi:hypothetical protein
MQPFIYATAFIFTLSPTALLATTVHRCEDSNGKVTFTHLGCRTDQQLHLQNADNPPPSGDIAPPAKKPEKPEKRAKKSEAEEERPGIVGIGQRQDGCGNLVTPSARRKAMINKEVRAGMSRADVESMLGKPDTISSQNGNVRYNYVDKQDNGRKRSVSFDADGCVKP